jgi:alkylhydroperoxidase/carboxymuconolactone decarboxylase family protein YurZ
LEKKKSLNIEIFTAKQKELVAIGNALHARDPQSIALHVEKALDAGASHEEIMQVVTFIIGDKPLLNAIIELLRALSFEENKRAPCISVVDDCRED